MEYRFRMENIYLEPVHITSLHSSCGCTTPRTTSDTLKTYETGDIIATVNTRQFLGQKDATITVKFDSPFLAEVQLHVSCFIRSDIVFSPGSVQFGSISQGTTPTKAVLVEYAGRSNWQIVRLSTSSPNLKAEARPVKPGPGSTVGYELTVVLSDNIPSGYFKEVVMVETNDSNPQTAQIPLPVEGVVVSALSASPSPMFFGVLGPTQKVVRNLVVRADKPFRILEISTPDDRFQVSSPTEAKAIHLVPVQFIAGREAGKIVGKLRLKTDLAGEQALEVSVDGMVVNGP